MSEDFFITVSGFQKLCDELNELIEVQRPEVVKAISNSRALGDLSENAEYHGAKQRQLQIEIKIAKLEKIKLEAKVIDPAKLSKSEVVFGSCVKVLDLSTNQQSMLSIVSEYEADISKGLISINSPIGQSLLGAKVGDVVEVLKPSGNCEYELIEIV